VYREDKSKKKKSKGKLKNGKIGKAGRAVKRSNFHGAWCGVEIAADGTRNWSDRERTSLGCLVSLVNLV
jgi:hypothetical protein